MIPEAISKMKITITRKEYYIKKEKTTTENNEIYTNETTTA